MSSKARLLLDRDEPRELIMAAAERALRGDGEYVVVTGSAGLGKTALLESCRPHLAERGFRVLRARAVEHERNFGFALVRALFAPVLTGEDDIVWAGSAQPAAAVLRPDLVPAAPGQTHVMYGLYWLIANLAQTKPLAVLLDDVHEADDDSLAFLDYLAQRVADLPLLVVVATRPRQQAGPRRHLDELRARPDAIKLSTLSRQAVMQLVSEILGDERADLVDACLEVSGGNPFYLRELLREINETNASADEVRELAPPTIVSSILLGLARLVPGAIPMAQACAVLGDGASLAEAAQLAELDVDGAAVAADALVSATVYAPGTTLAFAHPILRSAVIADLGTHQLGRWHARAFELLDRSGADPQRLAGHLLQVPPNGSERVVHVLREAADAAHRSGSPAAIAVYLRRALEEPPPAGTRCDLLFDLGLAEAARADTDAIGHLQESVGESRGADRARRALVLAELCRKAGLIEPGLDLIEGALAEEIDAETAARLQLEHHWIARTHLRTVDRSRAGLADLLPAHAFEASRQIAAAHLGIEAAIESGTAAAVAFLTEALQAPGVLARTPVDSSPVGSIMLALWATEQHARFDEFIEAVLESAMRLGNVVARVWASIYQAMELCRSGLLLDAAAEAEAALAISAQHGWPQGSPELHATLAESLLERGELAQARRVVDAAPFPTDAPEDYPTLQILAVRGQLELADGRPGIALADLRNCGERLRRLRADTPAMLDWRSPAALAHRALGEQQAARDLAHANCDLAAQLAGPIALTRATRVLGTVEGSVDRLTEAVALADAAGSRLEQARTRAELGALLRRSGRTVEARGPLALAVDYAQQCQAVPLAGRASDELRIAGGRPRRFSVTGPNALTPAELRVTRLAAGGATNTEIAQRLFVSSKTVEKHLARAYDKLGIASRRELASVELP